MKNPQIWLNLFRIRGKILREGRIVDVMIGLIALPARPEAVRKRTG